MTLGDFFKPSLNWLLIFVPVTVVLDYTAPERGTWIFLAACLSIIPLAGWMGRATEHLAEKSGEGVGGLLNATFGNAAELIIAIFLLMIGAIIYVDQAQRRIPIQFAKRVRGRRVMGGQSTYIPLKVNTAGVIPVIFAASIMAATLAPTLAHALGATADPRHCDHRTQQQCGQRHAEHHQVHQRAQGGLAPLVGRFGFGQHQIRRGGDRCDVVRVEG